MLNDKKLSIKCLILTVVGLLRFMTLSTFIFWILRYRCWFGRVKILGRILDSNTIWLKLYIFRLLICKISIILLEWTNTKFTVSLWQFFNVTERLRKKRFLNRCTRKSLTHLFSTLFHNLISRVTRLFSTFCLTKFSAQSFDGHKVVFACLSIPLKNSQAYKSGVRYAKRTQFKF